jgi:hypothetical protein|tara:strand:+ start:1730 stop:2212 length:483 start_codon:yes stop_codon:yes gene_type:complete
MPADSWKLAPGLNNVGSYQVSGQPFTSGSCLAPASGSASLVIRFPAVTKWFQIEPHQSEENDQLRVAFSENGLHGKGGANFRLHTSSSLCRPLDMKVSELWFMGDVNGEGTFIFDLVAGLTQIPPGRTDTSTSASAAGLTTINGVVEAGGPNWSGSIGVG